jgi:hypothetical protein
MILSAGALKDALLEKGQPQRGIRKAVPSEKRQHPHRKDVD